MLKSYSLNYGDLSLYLSSYPPEAPMMLDILSIEDTSGEFEVAAITVGQSLAHVRTMPKDGCPLIPTEDGPHEVIGVLFAVEGPILILSHAKSI